MKVILRRNRHNLTHYVCGSCAPGEVIPVACVPVAPGDKFNHRISGVTRFLPLNAPIMHRTNTFFYSFFVSQRIVMDPGDWEEFITRNPTTSVTIPTMALGNIKGNAGCARLADYLGIQTDTVVAGSTTTVSSIPFRVYNAIWNEWFRDKDLQATPLDVITNDVADFAVRRGAWKKDPYTAARLTPQLGADVSIPLQGSVNVSVHNWQNAAPPATPTEAGTLEIAASTGVISGTDAPVGGEDAWLIGTGDLEDATMLVRSMRRAVNLQSMAERLMQYGHDLPSLYASMGVKSSDARLQRPEYLGGGRIPVSFSEVLRTGDDSTGEMFGHGIAPSHVPAYRHFFEEYGYIMTVMVVRPDPIYSTIIPRHFFHGLYDGANDFYTPELERIGQQIIKNKEIYPRNPANSDESTWGYRNQYDELRREASRVCGLLRVGKSLDYWTWARGFDAFPALNEAFITCNPDTRVFQDTDEAAQNVIFAVNHHMIAQRMLGHATIGRTM